MSWCSREARRRTWRPAGSLSGTGRSRSKSPARRSGDGPRRPLPGARQEVRRGRRRRRPRPRRAGGRVLRPAGAQWRREDDHGGDPRRPARADRGGSRGPGDALEGGRAVAAEATRHLPSRNPSARQADGRRGRDAVRIVLRQRASGRRGARAGLAFGQAAELDREALRRPEAAAGGGLRAGVRPGAPLPRRAHHRARSAVPPPALGGRARVQEARPHRPHHHPLHGRGGAALLPRRGGGSGQGDRARHAGGAHRLAGRPAGDRGPAGRGAGRRRVDGPPGRPPRIARRRGGFARCGKAPPDLAGAARTHPAVHAPGNARGRLREPDRKAAARMRADPLWQLTLARLRMFFREPSAVFWTFGFPLALSVALGVAFRNKPPDPITVGVWSGPDASGSRRIVEVLRATKGIEVREYYGPSTRDLGTGKIALFVRPGERLEYDFDPTRPESRLAREVADAALQRASGRADVLPTTDRPVAANGSRYIDFLIPGLIGMNIMSGSMWGIGYVVVEMRTRKLLKRLMATPMSRAQFLTSFVLMRAAFFFLELPLLLLFGWFAFGVGVAGSLTLLVGLSLLGALAFAGLGLLVAARAQNTQTVSGLINLVMLPMFIGSGVFFSTARFPDVFQPFLRALPLTALNDSVRAVMIEGAGPRAVAGQAALLAAIGGVSFALALRLFRWR